MSLELLEAVMCWESTFDVEICDAPLETLTTPARAVEFLSRTVVASRRTGPCLTMRAFHRVRRELLSRSPGVDRNDIGLDVELTALIGRRLGDWRELFDAVALPSDWISDWPLLGRGEVTMGHVVSRCVAERGAGLLEEGERWSRSQVRDVVRSSVRVAAGNVSFTDDDSFASMGF